MIAINGSNSVKRRACGFLAAFAAGAAIYSTIEILWRGHTHWTMTIFGGLCMTQIYALTRTKLPLLAKWLIGSAAIVAGEFTVGCIVNLKLGWNVWHYNENGNILGQICPLYSLYWLCLCLPAVYFCMLAQ